MNNKQPEALRLADAISDFYDPCNISTTDCNEAAAELRRLHEANKELLEALKMNAQALSWQAFGECRGFADRVPASTEALGVARAAIAKHRGQQ